MSGGKAAGQTVAYEPGQSVEVKYPTPEQAARLDRDNWPWLPGTIEEQCGPDEWSVVVDFAILDDGTPAPEDADDGEVSFPVVFRDSSEIRAVKIDPARIVVHDGITLVYATAAG